MFLHKLGESPAQEKVTQPQANAKGAKSPCAWPRALSPAGLSSVSSSSLLSHSILRTSHSPALPQTPPPQEVVPAATAMPLLPGAPAFGLQLCLSRDGISPCGHAQDTAGSREGAPAGSHAPQSPGTLTPWGPASPLNVVTRGTKVSTSCMPCSPVSISASRPVMSPFPSPSRGGWAPGQR